MINRIHLVGGIAVNDMLPSTRGRMNYLIKQLIECCPKRTPLEILLTLEE